MGLLDIDEVKALTQEYFIESEEWWKSFESPHWTVYTRHIRIDAKLYSDNEHYQKIGELALNFHYQTKFKNKNHKLHIYFLPATAYSKFHLSAEAWTNFDKLSKYINKYIVPYQSNDVNDQLTLTQYIGGICAELKKKDLRLVEFKF